jgi:hypothetical protein
MFKDSHFDSVYVDALHTRDALLADLRTWWPKVRPGGLMSGDDYGDIEDTEYITKARYVKMIVRSLGSIPYAGSNKWGVIGAVQQFARETGAVLRVSWAMDCYFWPAWYIMKPPLCVGGGQGLEPSGSGDSREG